MQNTADARHAHAGDALLVDYDVDEQASPLQQPPPQFDARPGAYAVNAARSAQGRTDRRGSRDPPPAGYLFPKADYKVSREAPPSPCKVCGSAKHWDKECPHWGAWSTRRDVNAITAEHDVDPQQDIEYHEVFVAYVMRSPMSNNMPVSALWCEALSAQATAMRIDAAARSARPPRPSVVEVPDADAAPQRNALPPSSEHILERAPAAHASEPAATPTPAPPVIVIKPSRRPAPGHSAVGIAALSFPGRIGTPDGPELRYRADSGADLSLISAEYLAGLPEAHRPRIHQGLKMSLYQLTSGAALAGYVSLPVLVASREGPLLQFEAECYVVPGMTVPVLLGEDFHLNYELGVQRRVQGGSIVQAANAAHFIKRRSHKRNQARRRRERQNVAHPLARAASDVRIAPFSNRQVPLRFLAATSAEWYLEKTVLGQADGSFLLTTPTLLSTAHPLVSVSNPTARPHIIRAGDLIGRLAPATTFDPATPELTAHAHAVAALVQSQLATDGEKVAVDLPTPPPPPEPPDDMWGPKTAEVPDPTSYPSADMEQILDISSD
ncbi:hypothetical protein FA95DRAFT_1505166 [Auriscalpium vulgare]|uniref:Uncharacterized protein n=1 Tax=Auriscalpium vulgare TaxID=40419 RepID=A0ACB8R3L6_9AGAM|nr:hypothetical protein FA95DRAFT_1505166 [Auriscalpium vulgare]